MTAESFQPVAPEPFQPAPPEPAQQTPFAPTPAPAGRSRGGSARWLNIALGLALVLAVGGVSFAAGRLTAPRAVGAFNANGLGGRTFQGNSGTLPGDGSANGGPGGRIGFGAGGVSVEGTVTAVTADSITITTASGQSVTVALNGSTTYHQQAAAASGDVKTGGSVIVRLGLRQSDDNQAQTGPVAGDITIVP